MSMTKSKRRMLLENQNALLISQEKFILKQIEVMKQQLNSLEVELMHLQRSQKHSKEVVYVESVNTINLDDPAEINKSMVDLSAKNVFLNQRAQLLQNESEEESNEED